jgi:hypothetical protein
MVKSALNHQAWMNQWMKNAVRLIYPKLDVGLLAASGALTVCPRVCWLKRFLYWLRDFEC